MCLCGVREDRWSQIKLQEGIEEISKVENRFAFSAVLLQKAVKQIIQPAAVCRFFF